MNDAILKFIEKVVLWEYRMLPAFCTMDIFLNENSIIVWQQKHKEGVMYFVVPMQIMVNVRKHKIVRCFRIFGWCLSYETLFTGEFR